MTSLSGNSNNKMLGVYEELKKKMKEIVESNGLMLEKVVICGRDLSIEEAIGNPRRQDFPLQKGKEKLLQADFLGALGQAYTDQPGYFHGTLEEVINYPMNSNYNRAVFCATLNAVIRYLNLIQNTIHCKDEEPEECAAKILPFIEEKYGNPRIALVGLQPALLESSVSKFSVRVLDLNADNIGKYKYGIKIEDGESSMAEVLEWSELILATGSTVCNGTITNYLIENKPTVFFGTTISGAAYLMGWDRYCACGK